MGGKKDQRAERAAAAQMARELDQTSADDKVARLAEKQNSKPIIDNGEEQLFEKKLSKEEKKAEAARKKAERDARKAAAAAGAKEEEEEEEEEVGKTPTTTVALKKSKAKETKAEKVLREAAELDLELEEARIAAVRLRTEKGAYMGPIESGTFSLSNPGGGPDLLERASYTLQRGRSYGLVGRNGSGKSTLLKAMASRRVGAIHPAVTVHYVSQEVSLTPESLALRPVDVVVRADVERRLLLAELAEMQQAEEAGAAVDGARQQAVLEQLENLDADTCDSGWTTPSCPA
jgi:hypothetical protein